MSEQRTDIPRDPMINHILNLEKSYFAIIKDIFWSEAFTNDLLIIEKEIRENYSRYRETYDIKNKLQIAAQRLVRHHIYTQLHNNITGIFPSPISPDVAVKTNDCILGIDVKTIDTETNDGDINYTCIEPNQTSFRNTNHSYISAISNLDSIEHYSRLPVLTYVFKIIYSDTNYRFKLSRDTYPTIVLTCIPNGELSSLFDNDIVFNFKDYKYYTEKDQDTYREIDIPAEHCNTTEAKRNYTHNYCVNTKHFQPIQIPQRRGSKSAYYDAANNTIWWLTSLNKRPVIRAVKHGSSTRLYNNMLKNRYDSNNERWIGYLEKTITEELS